jgi:large subunit ribosomal protein L4
MTAEVYNLKNEKVGNVELDERLFGSPWNAELIHQVVVAQMANLRRPWAHAKGRGEVRGGGRKPWRQKGTGRARHGSIRSPLWRGGGKAHGPNKERDFSQKINKKMKRLAVLSILSRKNNDHEIKIIDNLEIIEPKTKILSALLKPILNLKKNTKKFNLLMIPNSDAKNIKIAVRNLVKTKILTSQNLNAYDLLNYKNIFIDQKALSKMADFYLKS